MKYNRLEAEFCLNGIVADTECDKIFSKRLVPNSSEFWENLNGKTFWQSKHAMAIPFAKFLYFVNINFRESVNRLAAIRNKENV